MNIQIFGKNKCFDTKKAERYFKERRVKYQYRDLARDGMAAREFDSVLRAAGGVDCLINWDLDDEIILQMKYTEDRQAREDLLFENIKLMKTPIVRNGKLATVGYCPEIWKTWE